MRYYVPNSELYHFGIKGQKWGIRRWQNEDGSYNTAGKERYDKKKYEIAKEKYRKASEANTKASGIRKSDIRIGGLRDRYKRMATARVNKTMARADMIEIKKGEKARDRYLSASHELYNPSGLIGLKSKKYDAAYGSYNSKMHKQLSEKYGKEYADKFMKKREKTMVAELIVSSAVLIGASALEAYMRNN